MNNIHDLLYINTNSLSRDLCNEIINLFECSCQLYDGVTHTGMNKSIKDTTDLMITCAGPSWDRINNTLSNELNYNVKNYVKKCSKNVSDTYNIMPKQQLFSRTMQMQKYNKNTGKYIYHHDYNCSWEDKNMREITFLWYINDVAEGGETEFWGQYGIKPEAGKLVLFPASWTFPHCGKVPVSNDKYIITGWLSSQY
jgi:hypothetical protein